MRVQVHYFAAAREAAGTASEAVELEGESTVATLVALLAGRHPDLGGLLGTLRYAVDEDFAPPEAPLADGADVALIPPVGGG